MQFSFYPSTLRLSAKPQHTPAAISSEIFTMENENTTRSLLTRSLFQLERMLAEFKEMKRSPSFCFQLEQHVAEMQAEIKEMKKLLGAKDEVEDATLYFCLGGLVRNTKQLAEHDVTWFAIPPRGVVDNNGNISLVFKEPPRAFEKKELLFGLNRNTPLAVGPYIFLISDAVKDGVESFPKRRVVYINTKKEEKEWKDAIPLVGEHAGKCHFVVANDRIYSFGPLDNSNYSLLVSYFDSQDLDRVDKGWKNVEASSSSSPTGLSSSSSSKILASKIEYDTFKGKPSRRALRALLFANGCRISYDFEDNTYEISEVRLYNHPFGGKSHDGDDIYFLIQNFDDSVNVKVIDYHAREWCMTPVIGLDPGYLPVASEDDRSLPPSRLVHLGNKRVCVVWTLHDGANDIRVHCTKFSVRVQKGGYGYYATKVSSQVYKVKDSHFNLFGAVAL